MDWVSRGSHFGEPYPSLTASLNLTLLNSGSDTACHRGAGIRLHKSHLLVHFKMLMVVTSSFFKEASGYLGGIRCRCCSRGNTLGSLTRSDKNATACRVAHLC